MKLQPLAVLGYRFAAVPSPALEFPFGLRLTAGDHFGNPGHEIESASDTLAMGAFEIKECLHLGSVNVSLMGDGLTIPSGSSELISITNPLTRGYSSFS